MLKYCYFLCQYSSTNILQYPCKKERKIHQNYLIMFLLLFFLISDVFCCFLTDCFLYFVRNVEWVTLTPSPRWIRDNPYFSFLNSKARDATDSSNLQLMTLVLLTKVATAFTACWHVRLIMLVLFLKGTWMLAKGKQCLSS